ncbi:MAG: RNB domain-containing ribonuclease, partial [Verrucomicrobiota bacterium]
HHRPRESPWKRKRSTTKRNADRPSGRVIRIQKRARETIVGNLQKTRFFHYVVPDDPRIINDIYVPDPAKTELKPKPKIGSKVVVKLHEWEQRHVNPEGEIVLNLGQTHEPQAELMAILHKYNLDPVFAAPVISEAKNIKPEVTKAQHKGRRDIRDVFTFTIDPDDAKDFDDALSVERVDSRHIKIGIHIADVSAYVRPGTQLDKEAQERGNSTYLVGTVIPMLPHELSNGICSLKEDVDRLVKSVFITFTNAGKQKKVEFANSIIRSNKRLTYKQALTLLKEDDISAAQNLKLPPAHQTGSTGRALAELSKKELKQLQSSIRKLWSIASKLRKSRIKSGSLELDMPETKIFVDGEGYADRLEKVEHDESHQLIEEFMLSANEIVARELRLAGMPCIYRVHEKPDEERLDELREYLATYKVKVADLTLHSEMKKLLQNLNKHPQGALLKTQVLRTLKKACYRSTPDGHYGLAKQDYAHFTSPIRRYADLVVHRIFDHHLVKNLGQPEPAGGIPKYNAAKTNKVAEHISLTEVNSSDAERESIKVKILEFFERELEKPEPRDFKAMITEVRNHGMFIELTESNAFGLVHASTMTDDLYRIDISGTALVGRRSKKRFEVGRHIIVKVERVDRFKRQVDFRVADMQRREPQRGRSSATPRGGKRPVKNKSRSRRS